MVASSDGFELAEVDLDRLERMSELQLLCFTLKTQLERLEREEGAASIETLRQSYGEQIAVLQRRLQDVRVDANTARSGHPSADHPKPIRSNRSAPTA